MNARIVAVLAAALLLPAPARAQSPAAPQQPPAAVAEAQRAPRPVRDSATVDRLTREVASELRCPVCQGESIQESPAELAQEMKSVVRDQLAAGKTPDEVKQYFVGRYGEWILLRPTTSGFNVMLYWLPPIMLAAGAVLVILLARRWLRAGTTPSVTQDHAD